MSINKKGQNPAQVQAPQSAQHFSTVSECNSSHQCQPVRAATKTERAYLLLLSSPGGVTEGDILQHCHLSSGRNYASQIERILGIRLHREGVPNLDGIGSHYRYSITGQADAERVAGLINKMRQSRKAPPLSQAEAAYLVAPYALTTSRIETA